MDPIKNLTSFLKIKFEMCGTSPRNPNNKHTQTVKGANYPLILKGDDLFMWMLH